MLITSLMKLSMLILVKIDFIHHGMVILVNLLSIYVVELSFHNSQVFNYYIYFFS